MAISKTRIISDTFILLGKQPINDIDTGNPIHAAALSIYDDIIRPTLLSKHPWRFAYQHQILVRLTADSPIPDWKYQFQLPTLPAVFMPIKVYPNVDYIIYQDKIFANVEELELDYIADVEEKDFPPYFVTLCIYALAANIGLLVTQKPNLEVIYEKKASLQLALAMGLDGFQMPNPIIEHDSIYARHFS